MIRTFIIKKEIDLGKEKESFYAKKENVNLLSKKEKRKI